MFIFQGAGRVKGGQGRKQRAKCMPGRLAGTAGKGQTEPHGF